MGLQDGAHGADGVVAVPVVLIDELLGVGRGKEKRVAGLREFRPDAFDLAPRADWPAVFEAFERIGGPEARELARAYWLTPTQIGRAHV